MKSIIFASLLIHSMANASSVGLEVSWSYENALSDEKIKREEVLEASQDNQAMEKTLLVVKTAEKVGDSLKAWEKECTYREEPEDRSPDVVRCRPGEEYNRGSGCWNPPVYDPKPSSACKTQREEVIGSLKVASKSLAEGTERIEERNYAKLKEAAVASGKPVQEAKLRKASLEVQLQDLHDLVDKLAANMEKSKDNVIVRRPPYPRGRGGWDAPDHAPAGDGGGFPSPAPKDASGSAGDDMNITTGGAQDAQYFRDQVNGGNIPQSSTYAAYGLINEFDLAVKRKACQELLCVSPAVAIDEKANRLYVQTGLGTNMKVDQFERPPVNISVSLDLSGSMSANDETNKSRLEWAKEALNKTLQNLVEGQDYFSLVGFSDDAEQLWPKAGTEIHAITKKDKAELRELVAALHTLGSTNLRAGVDLAYKAAAASQKVIKSSGKKIFEHRVLLLTDANLNTGDTDEASAVIEVEKQSRVNGINLTTIGIGERFNSGFVSKISIMRGSNYIFAQNGERMNDYFEQFDTLVTPVAYDFVARLEVKGVKAKLVKIHGVPETKELKDPAEGLIDIRTLFFASPKSKGGGAQVLEYQLND